MEYPKMDPAVRLARLEWPARPVRMVLDTDTYNEIDDQFAVVMALLSGERMRVEALYAAPFHNARSTGPADGMEKSYAEILRLVERLGIPPEGLVHRGATAYLGAEGVPPMNDATGDIIRRALASPVEDPLYVVGIAAITDVAAAILLEPRIIERIVVVWLGGHALHWPETREFNLKQDVRAARVIFDSGVPVVHIPCCGVTTHLHTTVPEIEKHVRGQGAIGDYLADIFAGYHADHFAWSKVIWDIAAIAWLIDPRMAPTHLVHSPLLSDNLTWSVDHSRHFIRYAHHVNRDLIFRDLFMKLAARAGK